MVLSGNSEVLERSSSRCMPAGCRSATSRPALWDATGELLISKSAVSEITDQLWADYEEFCERSLDDIEDPGSRSVRVRESVLGKAQVVGGLPVRQAAVRNPREPAAYAV